MADLTNFEDREGENLYFELVDVLLPKEILEWEFCIPLLVDNSVSLAEIKSSQPALYSQLDPCLWLPQDQPPSFLTKEKYTSQLMQQCLLFDESVFSRIVYTLQGNTLNLIYLQLLPDREIDGINDSINRECFSSIVYIGLNACLMALNDYARGLGMESIKTEIYNQSLLSIFKLAGYQEISDTSGKDHSINSNITLILLLEAG